jgi:hypothetical protein
VLILLSVIGEIRMHAAEGGKNWLPAPQLINRERTPDVYMLDFVIPRQLHDREKRIVSI